MSDNPGWLEPSTFAFASAFERSWESIQQEALSLLAQGQYTEHRQSKSSGTADRKLADHWKVFNLRRPGEVASPEKAPVTWSILQSFEEITNGHYSLAYFSLLPAGAVVAPHRSNLHKGARQRHQLCLTCPSTDDLHSVYIQVNGEKRGWQQGKLLSFDDAYVHDVKNLSSESRLVLLFDSSTA